MYRAKICAASLLIGVGALTAASPAAAQTAVPVTFNVPGPADWNTGSNWSPANVPEAGFSEVAIINGDRSVFVDDTPLDVGRIGLDAGSLEIRPGGALTATAATAAVNGALQVGNGTGVGNLTIRRGGTLNVQNILLHGGATSRITLGETGGAGTATLTVAGGTLARTTRIVGPNVNFTSNGTLIFGSSNVLNPVITGPTHSTITVNGLASFGGVVRPEFSGYTPVLGDSWNLVTATSLNDDFAVDASLAPAGPIGTRYVVTKSATTATLRYTNALVLTVNRANGGMQIRNAVGAPIGFDAYTISSPSGVLSGAWNSLQDQAVASWDEADNAAATRLTEFRTAGTSSLNSGQQLAIGNPYNPAAPSKLGIEPGTDLSFQYHVPGQGTVDGIVEFVGGVNNLVLTIDPATGKAAIQNESPYFSASIDGYTITSASGKLLTANGAWNSLQDQGMGGWDQADNASALRLTEFKTSGSTLLSGGGTVLNLGVPVSLTAGALALNDFGFQYKLTNGEVIDGVVRFGTIPTFNPSAGDYNNDGKIDGADFLAWQRGFGSSVTPGSGADGSGNGVVDAADLTIWKSGFGSATATVGSATAAVPEPATVYTLLIAMACLGGSRFRPAAAGVRIR